MSARRWALVRAVVLSVVAVLLSPVSPLVLVTVCMAVLLLAHRTGDVRALALAVLVLVLAFTGTDGSDASLWYAERGWALLAAGGFVLAGPAGLGTGVLRRGLAGLAAAAAALGVSAVVDPGLPGRLDWRLSSRIHDAALSAQGWVGGLESSALFGGDLSRALFEWAGVQAEIYPAMLALATLAALGVGWYVVGRFAGRAEALPALRDFRFGDGLVWVLVLGLAALLWPAAGETWSRLGGNAALFMACLYLMRGVGILIWVAGATLGSAWSAALWGAAALLLYPVAGGLALLLGLSDTWLDVRGRLARASGGGG